MKDKKYIEQEVDKTLNSLEGLQKATPGLYMFTRVKARLERGEKNFWTIAWAFLCRPAVAFTTIIAALFINIIIFFEFRSDSSQSAGEGEQLFANEYNLVNNTIYDSTIEPE
jgi:hypothetical protein